eukprot:9486850-Alexandrium_andersonii.AAC.2
MGPSGVGVPGQASEFKGKEPEPGGAAAPPAGCRGPSLGGAPGEACKFKEGWDPPQLIPALEGD